MVSRGPTRRQVSRTKTIIVGSFLAVLTAVLIVVFVVRLASEPGGKVQLGDEVFEVGQVRRLAPSIEQGGPLLFADPLKKGRDLFVNHFGTDATTGWQAFEALVNHSRTCPLVWHDAEGVFKDDKCTHAVYPADGKGLIHYPTEVKRKSKGGLTLYVDLRQPMPG
jgi:hypothetical protein